MIELRPYQTAAIDRVRQRLRTCKRVLLVAPTGAGKTVIASSIMVRVHASGKRQVFFAHRRELIHQTRNKLLASGVPESAIGVMMGSDRHARRDAPIQIASIDTWRNREPPPAEFVFIDEAHRSLSPSYKRASEHYLAQGAWIVGMTATPYRANGNGLGEAYDALEVVAQPPELIGAGFLVAPRILGVAPEMRPDLSEVRSSHGDYIESELNAAVNRSKLVGHIVEHWLEHAERRRTVVFAVSVEHSRAIVQRFLEAGVTAEHLDGETPQDHRDGILARVASGDTLVVSNCGVLCEGWDLPSVKCAVLARPTESKGLYLQQAGRILRPWEGVGALILDHAGNALVHGCPQDVQEFSLETKPRKKKGPGDAPSKECPACFEIVPLSTVQCACGHEFPQKRERGEMIEDDGKLVEIVAAQTAEMLEFWKNQCIVWENTNRFREGYGQKPINPGVIYHRFLQYFKRKPPPGCVLPIEKADAEAKSEAWAQLRNEAEQKGYKPGWAFYRFKQRFGHPPPAAGR